MRDVRTLGPYPSRITERLDHWAERAPIRPFLAERDAAGDWAIVTYAGARERVRRLAQALLNRRLSRDRPIVILSGNSIDHALLGLAAMYSGVPYAPVAPAYSVQARDYGLLGRIFDQMQPGLVFVDDPVAHERALRQVLPAGTELVVAKPDSPLPSIRFRELEDTPATAAVDAAHAAVGSDTVAKILFTSGSTGRPKGVINTQRMLSANQEMLRTVFGFLADEPPVLCDWLPWNHTAGGNHNFGIVLYNGGTFYIDGGRPTPDGIGVTVRNLRDVAATAHFTVPRTYEALLPYLRTDRVLRERFFSRLKILFYAAAGLSQRFFDDVQALAVETLGEELLWVTGLGATETAPFAVSTGCAGAWSGFVGFPVPGVELKLAPVGDKLEARMRGPHITPGYWGNPELTAAAFDEEGYYCTGDAFRPLDPADLTKGFVFDGRLAEDFKLSSGTWVSVGPLRARMLLEMGPCAQDVVIAAPDREFVAALVFPHPATCRGLCPDLGPETPWPTVVADGRVRERFRTILAALARESTGASTHVARAILVDTPPSIDLREITDKGSLNQKMILANRAALVDELYQDVPSARTIAI